MPKHGEGEKTGGVQASGELGAGLRPGAGFTGRCCQRGPFKVTPPTSPNFPVGKLGPAGPAEGWPPARLRVWTGMEEGTGSLGSLPGGLQAHSWKVFLPS